MPLRNRIKNALGRHRAFVLATELAWSVARTFADLDRRARERGIVSLRTTRPSNGKVLLSYFLEPFLTADVTRLNSHTRYWESQQMARTCLELGYDVDVISWRNDVFWPSEAYAAVIDPRNNLERLAPHLPAGCVKIFHADVAHILFHNAAEARRLLALQQRRGATLRPRRFEWPNLAIEHADYAATLGNAFTIGTYRYAGKPIYRLPVPSAFVQSGPIEKDWDGCRRRVLFFSSGGLVHKGLDLALEAFARLPGYELVVCAPLDGEPDFVAAYRRELGDLPNIHVRGWVEVGGPEFLEVTRSCLAVLSPSCSEGGGGAVITCMHAGLIPIVTFESSVDVAPFGVQLEEASSAAIRHAVETLAAQPMSVLRDRALAAQQAARARHTRERYAMAYRGFLEAALRRRATDALAHGLPHAAHADAAVPSSSA